MTETQTDDVRVETKALAVMSRAEEMRGYVDSMGAITSDEEEAEQKTYHAAITKALRDWDVERHTLTDPLESVKKDIIRRYTEAAMPAVAAKETLGGRIKTRFSEVEAAALKDQQMKNAAAKRLQEKMSKKAAATGTALPEPVIPMPSIPEPARTMHTEAGRVTVKKVWTFEMLGSPEDAVKACIEAGRLDLLIVNEKVVGANVRAGVRDIPGIRVFQKLAV